MAIIDQLASTWATLKIILWIAIPLMLPLGLWIYKKRLGKYPIDAIIFEKRGENLVCSTDALGLIKADELTKYRLKKNKETIPVLNYEWILSTKKKPMTFLERIANMLRGVQGTAFLFKYGSKQYKPIDVNIRYNPHPPMSVLKEVKNKQGESVWINIYQQINPNKLSNLNFDVIDWDNMNFMVQEQRSKMERWADKKAWLQQYFIPALIIGAAVLVFIFSSYYAVEMWKMGAGGMSAGNSNSINAQPVVNEENPGNIPGIGGMFSPGS